MTGAVAPHRRHRYGATVIRTLALLCFVPAAVLAQVSVDTGALDHLSPAAPAAKPDSKPAARAHHPVHHHPAHEHRAEKPKTSKPETGKPETPATVAPAEKPPGAPKPPRYSRPNEPVTLAPTSPPAAVLAPPPPLPPVKPLPPPAIPVAPDATGEATTIPGGVRITFAPGKADLNPATEAALRALGKTIAADPTAVVNVYAYAAGTTDDPSTPRRVSLSRALAARAVLMSEGIASTRIYPRALGNTPSAGPPDRVDVQQPGPPPAPTP